MASARVAVRTLARQLGAACDDDVLLLVSELETVARRLRSLQLDTMHEVDRRGLHAIDGHGTAKIHQRYAARLNGPEAAARDKTRKLCRTLPTIGAAYAAGEIRTAHVDLLGRVHANPRVRNLMAAQEARFLADATAMPFKQFEQHVRLWERLADQDGPQPLKDRGHENRDFRAVQDFNTSWVLSGTLGPIDGADTSEIFSHYLEQELLADWETARSEHGSTATEQHLARTPAMRRADALLRIFRDAAAYDGSPVPANRVHNIVWAADTFEEMIRRLDPHYTPKLFDPDDFGCEPSTAHPSILTQPSPTLW